MDNGTTGSLVQLVICHEMIRWVRQYLKPLRIDSDSLALDVIAEVAERDGDFLDTDHTVRHCHDEEYPPLIDRSGWEAWMGGGGQSLADRARVRVEEILAEPPRPRLSTPERSRIEELLESRLSS